MSAVEHAALESRAHAARTTGRAAAPATVPGFTEPLSLATDEGPPADIDLREHDVDVDVTVSEQPARD
jgi:hypothetical protein